jgi:hypothetical protein
MSVFGLLSGPEDVEKAVLAALQKWLPTYLREVERHRGLEKGALPEIRSYSIVSDYDRYPQEQLPSIVIESAGLVSGSLEQNGKGYYSGRYAVEVSVTYAADEGLPARFGAERYGEAVRAALVQNALLDEDVELVAWVDESTVGENDKRSRRVTNVNAFEVALHNIVSDRKGPADPDPDAPNETATVQEIDVQTEVKE